MFVSSLKNEFFSALIMSAHGRQVEGRLTQLVGEIDVHVPGSDELHRIVSPVVGGPVENSASRTVSFLPVYSQRNKIHHHFNLISLSRNQDRVHALKVLGVNISAQTDEGLQHWNVPLRRAEMQGCVVVVVGQVNKLFQLGLSMGFFYGLQQKQRLVSKNLRLRYCSRNRKCEAATALVRRR